jgi:hypothetical protein
VLLARTFGKVQYTSCILFFAFTSKAVVVPNHLAVVSVWDVLLGGSEKDCEIQRKFTLSLLQS